MNNTNDLEKDLELEKTEENTDNQDNSEEITEEEINDLLTMATFDKSNKKFKYKDFIKTVLETK